MGHRSVRLSFGCECVARVDVVGCQVREVFQNLLLGHPRGEVAEDIINRNPHSADARLASALPRLDGDDVLISHDYDFIAL